MLWPIYRNNTASRDYIDTSTCKWLQQLHHIFCTFQFCMQHQTFIKIPLSIWWGLMGTNCWPSFNTSTSVHHSSSSPQYKAATPSTKQVTQWMYQGASQRNQLSQNSGTNYFSELLHPVIFPLSFLFRTLHVRQSDRAFSITISVLECSLKLPCR